MSVYDERFKSLILPLKLSLNAPFGGVTDGYLSGRQETTCNRHNNKSLQMFVSFSRRERRDRMQHKGRPYLKKTLECDNVFL